jgi:hypothetical protein
MMTAFFCRRRSEDLQSIANYCETASMEIGVEKDAGPE